MDDDVRKMMLAPDGPYLVSQDYLIDVLNLAN
jgi:hypothetical protein